MPVGCWVVYVLFLIYLYVYIYVYILFTRIINNLINNELMDNKYLFLLKRKKKMKYRRFIGPQQQVDSDACRISLLRAREYRPTKLPRLIRTAAATAAAAKWSVEFLRLSNSTWMFVFVPYINGCWHEFHEQFTEFHE